MPYVNTDICTLVEKYCHTNGYNYCVADWEQLHQPHQPTYNELCALARAYEDAPHSPDDPSTSQCYGELAYQLIKQYKHFVCAGYTFRLHDADTNPYTRLHDVLADIIDRRNISVYSTEAGFGSGTINHDHALLEDSLMGWVSEGEGTGVRTLINDLFRAMHDIIGHAMCYNTFDKRGEYRAWAVHRPMFTGKAVHAFDSETRWQHIAVYYGKHAEHNKTAKPQDTIYADQKMVIPPVELTKYFIHSGDYNANYTS